MVTAALAEEASGGEGADGSWEVEFSAARAAGAGAFGGEEEEDWGGCGAGGGAGGGDGEDGAEGARRHALAKGDPVRTILLKQHVQGAKTPRTALAREGCLACRLADAADPLSAAQRCCGRRRRCTARRRWRRR